MAKSAAALITPARATPGGVLPLSSIDRSIVGGLQAHTVQVFDRPPSSACAVAALREGLARALVPYYPVGGRVTPCGGAVDCTGELGVWLLEAAASGCDAAGVLDGRVPGELLLPGAEKLVSGAVLAAQVTRFACGGVAVGVSFSHAVMDGHGAGQFLCAVGEHARGVAPSVASPVWARDALIPDIPRSRPPRGTPPPPMPEPEPRRFVYQVADVSPDSIARVRKEYSQLTKKKACSVFDAVTAVVFKCRALALLATTTELGEELRLGFAVGTQHLVLPAGVAGYYGNCGNMARVRLSPAYSASASLGELVVAIREGKEKLEARVAGWLGGRDGYFDPAPFPVEDYGTVAVSDVRHLGFTEVDYGFGEPRYFFPPTHHLGFPNVYYVKPPKPKAGVRLLLRCVREPHAAAFAAQLAEFARGRDEVYTCRSRI
ncbi:acyl transferase 7 [Brachypodium distachyon]|uniref:Uncharacterized protein n=1 Tax=Brachypodium distachyon TaxID=15368 RepID=I1H119_BRADI|nr:acyl transferase 7 [Brachypodium distachyon]KQK19616.1 hypothetical protein BRADI_1g49330v3 [Brachypodium distachyon]|eukprot:XP_003561101.1 acyl transferase 7 [Brachypodium distachyon]